MSEQDDKQRDEADRTAARERLESQRPGGLPHENPLEPAAGGCFNALSSGCPMALGMIVLVTVLLAWLVATL